MRRASASTSVGDPASNPFTGTTALEEGVTSSGSVLLDEDAYRFQRASSSPNRAEDATWSRSRPNAPHGSTQSSSTPRPTIDPASRRSCRTASSLLSTLKPGRGAVSPQPSEPSSPDSF